jgi:hypothetical protein
MPAVQTLEDQGERGENAKDLRSRVISVARPTRCPSNLRVVGPSCVVIASAQIARRSRGSEFTSVELEGQLKSAGNRINETRSSALA